MMELRGVGTGQLNTKMLLVIDDGVTLRMSAVGSPGPSVPEIQSLFVCGDRPLTRVADVLSVPYMVIPLVALEATTLSPDQVSVLINAANTDIVFSDRYVVDIA